MNTIKELEGTGEYEPVEVTVYTLELRFNEFGEYYLEQAHAPIEQLAKIAPFLPIAEFTEAYSILKEAENKLVELFHRR